MSDMVTNPLGFSWGMPSVFPNRNYLNAPISLADRVSSIFPNQIQGQMSPAIPTGAVIGTQVNPTNFANNIAIGNGLGSSPTFGTAAPVVDAVKAASGINPAGTINHTITPTNGVNQYGQQLYNGGTIFDWAGMGLNTAFSLWNGFNQYKGLKLAKQNFEEQKKLNHANYKMQAKAYNSNLRNQQSGRGYVGMSGSAVRELGREYNENKADKDY